MKIDEVIDFLMTEAEKSQPTTLDEQGFLYNAAVVVKKHRDYFMGIYEDLGR